MGAFDDLIPKTDQTTVPVDQKQITDKSLNRKQEGTPDTFGETSGIETGSPILPIISDIAKTSEGIRAGISKLGPIAGPLQVGMEPERVPEAGKRILQGLFGEPEEQPEFGTLAKEEGVPEKIAPIVGIGAELATDPLSILGAGEAGAFTKSAQSGSKELTKQVAKESLEAADTKIAQSGFDLTPEKTFDDFNKQIESKQNALVEIDKNPMLEQPEKIAAKQKVANEMDDLKYEQVLNEMSDFKNDVTKRTIFTKKPNELTSLVQTYISNRGQFGNALYRAAERASDTMDSMRAKWFTAFENRGNLPKVFSNLSKDQRSNFMAAMEGFEGVSDPVVKQLTDIAKANRAEIAGNAIKRGVQVKNANSSTSKFFSIKENHMPHYTIDPNQVLNDPNVVKESLDYSVRTGRFKDINEAQKIYDAYANATKNNVEGVDLKVTKDNEDFFNWLVKNKQAKDVPDAVKRFQFTQDEIKTPKSGSLESERIIDIPFYDTNPERVLTRYYSSVAKRFGEIDNFGRNNEIANNLIEGIRKEFGDKDAERVSNMVNMMTGSAKPSQMGATTAQVLRDIEAARKLSLAVFMNITQSGNTAAVTGINNASKALIQAFTKEGRDYAYKAGVLFSEAARSMYGVSDDLISGKIVNAVLNTTGFTEVEKTNRIISALAAKHFSQEQAMKYIASNGTNETAARALRNMGLHPDSILKRGSIAEKDMLTASRYITNRTQFRSRVLDSPEWANSPWGKVFNQFKNYSENQVKFIREELINEARQGNVAPIVRFAAVAPPIYAGAKAIKDAVRGKDRRLDTRTNWEKGAEIAANMGMFGMYYDILQSMNFKGQGWVASMVPALDTIGKGGSAAFEALRPLGNRFLGQQEAKLLNLKPLTRFAAESVPIFGNRLKEAMKEPEDKQREASRSIREATERGQDVSPILDALREDKRVDVSKARKSAKTGLKRKATIARKEERATRETDDVKRALIKLGLVNVPSNKR